MLQRSFQFVPRIGAKTERRLWEAGIHQWDHLLERPRDEVPVPRLPSQDRIQEHLTRARQRLDARDASYFSRHLPSKEHWRLYGPFQDRVLFLDIETTGLRHERDELTVVGTYDGERCRVFLQGCNLNEVVDHLNAYDLFVTFNGTTFDVPFLRAKLPGLRPPPAHIDLRHVFAGLGYKGGLKRIERSLGLDRTQIDGSLNGWDAVRLWYEFLDGNDEALEALVQYNLYDVVNLRTLMDVAYCWKARSTGVLEVPEPDTRAPDPAPLVSAWAHDEDLVRLNLDGETTLQVDRRAAMADLEARLF